VRPSRLLPLPLVLCLLAACERGEEGLSEADIAAIHQLGQEFTQANVAHDWDRVLAQRTDDVVWMPPNAAALPGKDAVRRFLQEGAQATAFTITSVHTEGSDDLAVDRGSYVYTGVMGSDTITDTGKYVAMLRRQPDDSWKIALEIWNSDVALPQPAPAPAAARRRS